MEAERLNAMKNNSRISIPGPRNYGGIFDFDGKRNRLIEVVKLTEDPAFWNDAKRAQDLGRERRTWNRWSLRWRSSIRG
jgi:peptide chain release factor 2